MSDWSVEEGVFVDGKWVPGRLLAGDDTGDKSLVLPRLYEDPEHPALFGASQKGIQRVTIYRYEQTAKRLNNNKDKEPD